VIISNFPVTGRGAVIVVFQTTGQGSIMKVKLNNLAIVLHRPRIPENIGAAARSAMNMGIGRLLVVDPRDCDLTRILTMATHNAEDIVTEMEVFKDLRSALASFHYVVGTTARTGSHRAAVRTPKSLSETLISISQNNQVAVLFGPEDRGLANNELRYCDELVTIPTADFSSLNLAQAVMIMAYEIHLASTDEARVFLPRRANRAELEGMYDHLQKTLSKINFINPENPEYWMTGVRRFFSRIGLRAREVKLVRGLCRQIDWYVEERLRRRSENGEG
jgi:tRNA/rRNA methyltransferase